MAAYFACFAALLLAVSVVHEAGGVISGPLFPRNKGLIEPTVLEIPEQEELPELARRAMQDRFRRQNDETDDHIGTLTPLSNDRHTHALVHWTGHPSPNIFILTRRRDPQGHSTESWLWRSTDYGKTFINETDMFDNDTVIEWYYISPLQNNLIFADRINHRLWVTTDEGETYTSHPISFDPDRMVFQSTLAPGSLEENLPLHVLGYDDTARELWVSRDLGENWNMLDANVVPDRYYWRVLGENLEPKTAVYYERAIDDTNTISELKWSNDSYQMSSYFDENLGQFAVNTFILTHEYMLVQKANVSDDSGYNSPLWVSHKRGVFKQAQFPLQTPERHYSVVDASEGQVFIAVYHSINNTNLYLSEEAGLSYALSLEYIISPPESAWAARYPTFDVHVVEGIVGTYIANRKVPGSAFGATVISFDKGGEWNQVTPPAADRNNIPIFCVPPECSLHLHIESDITNGYQSILTQDSAIGLIMALGNLGSSLQSFSRRLYFSHDGGFSWQEVEENFWEFQFAALGSIVVTIPKWTSTDYIRWSCDEGSHWNVTTFVDDPIRVVGMLTERGEKANHVTVFGYGRFGFTEWLVIDLNFTQVVPDQCLPEDYYIWIPTDERPGSRCLLGEVVQYERRKSDECCFVNPDYEKPVETNACTCTIEDFECDFGFERLHLNSPCTPMPSTVWPPLPPADCLENETYNFTSGYRKVAGDKCVRGNETYFFSINRTCPVRTPLGLFIQYSPSIVIPKQSVTFILTQLVGSELLTVYLWDFNDSSPVVNKTGLEQARQEMHTFDLPGVYAVKVTAKNDAGQSDATVDVSVLDSIKSVVLLLPPQYRNGVVPVQTELAFQANFSTEYGTNVVGNVILFWSYGDSATPDSTSFSSTTHTYSSPGTYSFSVTVRNPRSNATTQATITVVQVPDSLNLTVSSSQLGAGQEVTFTLQQVPEFTGDTNYTFNYGDASVDHFSSLAQAQTARHTYQHPGEYVVTVTAFNIAGQKVVYITITVLDSITDVSVSVTPYPDRHVPIDTPVLYKANFTQFGSELQGSLNFMWDWGDGSRIIQSHTSSYTHTYSDVGTYTLNVTVSNGVTSNFTVVDITTFTFPNDVQISSSGSFFDDGFAEVKQSITLQAMPKSGEVIPANTTLIWNVSGPADFFIMNEAIPSYNFPERGTYQVLVRGIYGIKSFSTSKTIVAEYQIKKLDVSVRRTVHSNSRAPANLTVSMAGDQQYIGPLNLTLVYNGSNQAGTYNRSSSGVQLLNIATGSPGVVNVVFRAGNDVSSVQMVIDAVVVVGQGQFGAVQLGFKTGSLPSNYQAAQWQAELMNTIIDYLVKKYTLEVWQLEVSIHEEIIATTIAKSVKQLHPVLRQSEQEFLLVDFNILPKRYEQQEIDSLLQHATEIVDMADKKLLNFTVNNTLIKVEKAELNGVVIISPGKGKQNYVPLGAGLGVGLIVLITLAIFAVVATIHYRRKYSRLRVRYSRLQQGPVRFTFTPGGQMVEEDEEDEDAGETQMETLQSDDDEKPVL